MRPFWRTDCWGAPKSLSSAQAAPLSSGGIERAQKCLQGWHFVRCCHSTPGLLFRGSAGVTRGGQQQFATQTLRVHLLGIDLLRTPGRFTTRPLPVQLTTKFPFLRETELLSTKSVLSKKNNFLSKAEGVGLGAFSPLPKNTQVSGKKKAHQLQKILGTPAGCPWETRRDK